MIDIRNLWKYEKKGECFAITSYCNTPEKLDILNRTIDNIKQYNLPIFLHAHYPVPEDILKKIHSCYYSSDNPILSRYNEFWYYVGNYRLAIRVYDYYYTTLRGWDESIKILNDYERIHMINYDTNLPFEIFNLSLKYKQSFFLQNGSDLSRRYIRPTYFCLNKNMFKYFRDNITLQKYLAFSPDYNLIPLIEEFVPTFTSNDDFFHIPNAEYDDKKLLEYDIAQDTRFDWDKMMDIGTCKIFIGEYNNTAHILFFNIKGVLAIILVIMMGSIIETNKYGYFQVKQAAISGKMTVRHEAGTYFQWFGNISTYRNVATVGIGQERGEGSADIEAVDVIFNDGSKATISGLVRIKLPTDIEGSLTLKREYSQGFEHFIRSGVVPIVNNAIKLSANLRSAQDAYTTLALFQQAVDDQLKNGIYVTKSDKVLIERSTGDIEEMRVTVLVYDENGNPIRTPNRLTQLGCEVLECVIDIPTFDTKVEEMISLRKDEAMKTELAKQSAIRAKQDALTAEEQGKANVAKAKYEQEVEKVKEVTIAQKQFEVAQYNAKKEEENKKATIFKGQAEAEANRLKVAAGLSPQERAEWDYKTRVGVAAELAKVNVPSILIGGADGKSGVSPMDAVGVNMLLDIMNKMEKQK